jgi:Fe-Mn family superoxide dismutase
MQTIEITKLDYNYNELEPIVSEEILTTHHSKHQQAYVNNFNKLL